MEGSQRANHSPGFRGVNWFGTQYFFTPNQAACVEMLWRAWEEGTLDVDDQTILTTLGIVSRGRRLRDVFKTRVGDKSVIHPAWSTMIVPGATKGTRRLSDGVVITSTK